jgi:hypothetical protein
MVTYTGIRISPEYVKKEELVKRIKKQITKFGLTDEVLGFSTS